MYARATDYCISFKPATPTYAFKQIPLCGWDFMHAYCNARAILCNNAVHFDPVAKTWIEMKAIFLKVIFSSAVKIHWGKTQRVRNGKKSRENVNQLKFLSFGFMSQSFNTKYVLFNVLKIHFDDKCFQSNEVQHNHILFEKLCSSECWKIYYKRIFFGGESRRQDVLCVSLWYSHSKPLEFVIFFARTA